MINNIVNYELNSLINDNILSKNELKLLLKEEGDIIVRFMFLYSMNYNKFILLYDTPYNINGLKIYELFNKIKLSTNNDYSNKLEIIKGISEDYNIYNRYLLYNYYLYIKNIKNNYYFRISNKYRMLNKIFKNNIVNYFYYHDSHLKSIIINKIIFNLLFLNYLNNIKVIILTNNSNLDLAIFYSKYKKYLYSIIQTKQLRKYIKIKYINNITILSKYLLYLKHKISINTSNKYIILFDYTNTKHIESMITHSLNFEESFDSNDFNYTKYNNSFDKSESDDSVDYEYNYDYSLNYENNKNYFIGNGYNIILIQSLIHELCLNYNVEFIIFQYFNYNEDIFNMNNNYNITELFELLYQYINTPNYNNYNIDNYNLFYNNFIIKNTNICFNIDKYLLYEHTNYRKLFIKKYITIYNPIPNNRLSFKIYQIEKQIIKNKFNMNITTNNSTKTNDLLLLNKKIFKVTFSKITKKYFNIIDYNLSNTNNILKSTIKINYN